MPKESHLTNPLSLASSDSPSTSTPSPRRSWSQVVICRRSSSLMQPWPLLSRRTRMSAIHTDEPC